MFCRFVPIALIMALLCATIPAPALATSTATEVQIGKEVDKEVTDTNGVVTDPLENAWVTAISQRLWTQVARKDVPYNIKILDVPDVNAFTTLGGYIYVNEGTLDFAQSDDELAGVIGHETGHDERRHAIQGQNKANILSILFGVASIFSPFIYRFGQIAQAGILAKMSRDDERQADKYGLMLMTRAGYDPDAMVSFMQHLGATHADHNGLVDKYLADHPGVPERVRLLESYPQLDPKVRTKDQELVAALHDEDETRYNIAAMKFASLLRRDPSDTSAQFHLGQMQLALGQTAKGEQNLAAVAAKGTPETQKLAQVRIQSLRETERRFTLVHPTIAPLRAQLAEAQAQETQAVTALQSRRESGRDQIKSLNSRLQAIQYQIPDFSRVNPRKGGRLEAVIKNLNGMSLSINTAINKSGEAISGVGSLEKNKEGGLLKENQDIYAELAAPLKINPIPPQSLSTLRDYPRMITSLQAADADMVRAVDAGRGALALLDVGIGDLDRMLRQLARSQVDFSGELNMGDYNTLVPLMSKASESLNKAAVAGSQASQLYDMARARQLEARISMLGLGYPIDRYSTLRRALKHYVGNDGIDFDGMVHNDLSPGEVASASIVAADTNTTPQAVIGEAKSTHRSVVDVANARGMRAVALEMFLGLVYLDYTDDPEKEARPSVPRQQIKNTVPGTSFLIDPAHAASR